MTANAKVDAYIAKAQPFARPVLEHIRKIIHKACKNCEETVKWSFPHFDYNGKIMCSMAAFKQHCAFGFWLAGEMKTMQPYLKKGDEATSNGMGHFGKIASIKDLPSEKELIAMVKEAMALSDSGVVIKRAAPAKNAELPVPEELAKAMANNKTAKAAFEKFPPSHRKEYIQWINDAKTDATRAKRITTTIEWVAEGKGRNWKYEKK